MALLVVVLAAATSGVVCGRPLGRGGDRHLRARRARVEHEPPRSRALVCSRGARSRDRCSRRCHAEAAGPVGRDGLHHLPVRTQLSELPALPPPGAVRSAVRPPVVASRRGRGRVALRRPSSRAGKPEPSLDPGDGKRRGDRPRLSRQPRALPAAQWAQGVHDPVAAEHLGLGGRRRRGRRRPQRRRSAHELRPPLDQGATASDASPGPLSGRRAGPDTVRAPRPPLPRTTGASRPTSWRPTTT